MSVSPPPDVVTGGEVPVATLYAEWTKAARWVLTGLVALALGAGAVVWTIDARYPRVASATEVARQFLDVLRERGSGPAAAYVCAPSRAEVRSLGSITSYRLGRMSELDGQTRQAPVRLVSARDGEAFELVLRLVSRPDGWQVCGVGPFPRPWPLLSSTRPGVATRGVSR